MSTIHYFQRYSQPENVATNNTLLLLSRLYHSSPIKFKNLLNDLLDDSDLEAGVQFNQQVKTKASIPDGSFNQESFKVVVETKRNKYFDLEQLTRHLESFGMEQYKILLSLSPKLPDSLSKSEIENKIKNYNDQKNVLIKYVPLTFQDIVTKFRSNLEGHDYQLIEIIEDFEEYCIFEKLIHNDDARMRVVTCGETMHENFEYSLYFDPASRGYSDHDYLGIYSGKAVRGIGKIENIIVADHLPSGELEIFQHTAPVTQTQRNNIISVIASAKTSKNWDISHGHKFFCVDKFYPTVYAKITKYPLQRSKFFNLKELLEIPILPSVSEIAERLKSLSW